MAREATPTVTQTKQNFDGTTDSPVEAERKVTYVFNTAVSDAPVLRIPYAVAVDGDVLPAYKDKPKRLGESNTITVSVKPGAKVALYLNSDAHASYRKNPVYEVSPGARDIKVTITEKEGLLKGDDKPVFSSTDAKSKTDNYTAPLTGAIWMKISHKYTAAEVDGLIPAGTSAEIKAAVKSIYDGLAKDELTINLKATATKPASTISIEFNDADNPRENIAGYNPRKDGLPRVHPGGFAALFNAAAEVGIKKLIMSSTWRPLLGSIAHRAGLGLDVNYVGPTRMNRTELRGGIDTSNVSPEEKRLFSKYIAARKAEESARKAESQARRAYASVKDDPAKAPAAQEALAKAEQASKQAADQRAAAEKPWNEERDKNEPAPVRAFRKALLSSPRVAQLFDPWFIDQNTMDEAPPTPNTQQVRLETLHSHHLHITVYEPNIL